MSTGWILEVFPEREAELFREPFHLREGVNTLGRPPDHADLEFPVMAISRKHCRLAVDGAAVWLEDLRSRNHTLLNGQQVLPGRRFRVEPDDVIWLPEVNLRLGRASSIDPAWLRGHSGTVLALALYIRAERDWELLPVLGDALEDGLCPDPEMPRTCRREAPRRCGSWVVDRILEAAGRAA